MSSQNLQEEYFKWPYHKQKKKKKMVQTIEILQADIFFFN